jgi:hypothetical protein
MGALLIVVGLVLCISAIRNTLGSLSTHFKEDIKSGPNGSFMVWVAALIVIGGMGYIPGMERISRWLLALVIIVLALKDGGGFYQSFIDQIENLPASTPAAEAAPRNLGPVPVKVEGATTGGSGGGLLGGVSSLLGGGDAAEGITTAANLALTAGL